MKLHKLTKEEREARAKMPPRERLQLINEERRELLRIALEKDVAQGKLTKERAYKMLYTVKERVDLANA